MFRTWWQKLFSFPRTRLARRRGYRPPTRLLGRTTRLSMTALEDRVTPATFVDNGTTLNLVLNTANTNAAVVSGGTSYTLTLTGDTWSGTNDANVTGNGTATLTVTAAGIAAFTNQISLADAAAASDSATFNNSGANLYANNFTINLSNAAAGGITFNGNTSFGSHSLSASTTQSITINGGATLSATTGNITLSANEQATPTAGAFNGVTVNGTVQATGAGVVSVSGRGGDTGSASGIVVNGTVSGGTTGTTVVSGTGGASAGGFSEGVFVTGAGAIITSAGAAVAVTGQGGGSGASASDYGVLVNAGATVTAGGTGTVTVDGTGGVGTGSFQIGVFLNAAGSTITSTGGAVSVTGHGAGGGAGSTDAGIALQLGGTITAGGSGTVTVNGTGGSGAGNGTFGIDLNGTGSTITSAGGAVSVTGQGGGSGASGTNAGITLGAGDTITAGGSGTVTVAGTGGATSGGSDSGVVLSSGGGVATITSGGGSVSVTGHGGGTGAGNTNVGVLVQQSSTISAGGTGTVTVAGTGGATTGAQNHGVWVTVAGAQITSTGGDVSVTGIAGSGTGALAVEIDTGTTVSSGGTANLSITADSLSINGTPTIKAGTAGNEIVSIAARTAGTNVNLGGADAPGTLGLTNAELARITAGILRIGDAGSVTNNFTVSQPITAPAGWNTLSLFSNTGSISQNAGASITVPNLLMIFTGAVGLTDPGNTVGTMSAVGVQGVQFVNSTSLTLDSVDPGLEALVNGGAFTGGVTSIGNISITAGGAGSLLTVNKPVSSRFVGLGPGNITLAADDMAINANVDAGTAIVTLEQGGTTARPIDLGLGTTANTLGLSTVELTHVTAGTLRIGRSDNAGSLTVTAPVATPGGAGTLSLTSGGAVAEAAAADTITVTNLAVRAGGGINLDTVVSHLAVRNTGAGNVRVANTGATTLTAVDTVDGTAGNQEGNFAAAGTTTFSAASPFTFAINFTSAGTITTTATETVPPTPNVDNVTVNPGITVQSTGGDVVFQAGDNIVVNATASVLAGGNVSFTSGFGDNDGEGAQTLDGTVSANASTGVVTLDLRAQQGATEAATGSITGHQLRLLGTGTAGSFALATSTTNAVDIIAAATAGAIQYRNSLALTVGTVGATVGITSTNSNVTLTAAGTITVDQVLNAGTATATLTSTAGGITQTATVAGAGVIANAITLSASTGIGGSGGFLRIAPGGAATTLNASTSTGNIGIKQTAGNMVVGQVNAGAGNVNLTNVAGTITSVTPNDGVAEVIGNQVTLDTSAAPSNGNTGQIGFFTASAQFFEIDANTLFAFTNNSRMWVRDVGSGATAGLAIGQVNAGNNTAFLQTTNGDLTSATVDGNPDILADTANLRTLNGGNIGTSAASPLEVSVNNLNAGVLVAAGGIHVLDTTGGVTVVQAQTVNGPIDITTAGASANITTANPGGALTSTISAPGNTVTLTATGAINSTTGAGITDVTATNLAVSAAAGIGSAANPLKTAVTNLAFHNTGGSVFIANTGALTINAVGALTTSSNTGVDTHLSAASPMTFAVDTTSGGTLTATTADNNGVHVDNITVNSGVTVKSTGGDVIFDAGDDVVINGTVQSQARDVDLVAGFGDTDTEGVITINGSVSAVATVALNVNSTNAALAAGTPIATEAAGASITAAGLLLLNFNPGAPGPFSLDASTTNVVGTVAATVQAVVNFRNNGPLTVGTVTSFPEGVTSNGIFTAGHDATLCTITGDISLTQGLNVLSATARLQSAGAVTQTAAGKITAGTLGVNAAGNIILDQATPTNHVTGTVALNSAAGTVRFMDDSTFTVGTVAAAGCFTGASGITGNTGGGAGQDVTICSPSTINITSPITAPGATVRIQSGGDVDQTAAGTITAANLGVRANGNVNLCVPGAANTVTGIFAADTSGGAAGSGVFFLDNSGYLIGTVTASTCFTADANGVTTNNGTADLVNTAGNVTLAQNISAGTGTVRLNSAGAVNSPFGGGFVTAANLAVRANGAVDLCTVANNITGIFAAQDTGAGAAVMFSNTGGFNVGTIADDACASGATGDVTNNGDVDLVSGGAITLDQAVNAGTATVRINGGAVTQTAGGAGAITAANLSVRATGNVDLCQVANTVTGTFAASVTAGGPFLRFLDTAGFTVGTVAGDACVPATTTGVFTTNGDISLTSTAGPITLAQAVSTQVPAGGTVRIASGGAVTQTAGGAGAITGGGLAVVANGLVDLCQVANDVGFFFAASDTAAGAAVRFLDSAGFTVDTIAADPCAPGATGVTTNNGDVSLNSTGGAIGLTQAVNAGTGAVRLNAGGAVTQTAGGAGAITAGDLAVVAAGNVDLCQVANTVTGSFAASDSAAGAFVRFLDTAGITVGAVAADVCAAGATGVTTNNGDVSLVSTAGPITLAATVNAGTGIVRLNSGTGVSQTAAVTGGGLAVVAAGNVDLTQPGNAVAGTIAVSDTAAGATVKFLDGPSFIVGAVAADPCAVGATGVVTNNGDATLVSSTGSIQLAQGVTTGTATTRLQAATGIASTAATGFITAATVGVRNTTSGDIQLDQANTSPTGTIVFAAVNNGTVAGINFRSAVALNMDTVTADGTLFNAVSGVTTTGTGGTVRLQETGLTQTAAGIVTTDLLGVRNTTAGDVMLDQANTLNTFAANNTVAGGRITLRDTGALTLGDVSAQGTFAATSGVTTNAGIAYLQAGGSIGQTATGLVNAAALAVNSLAGGTIRLDQANAVNTLAANNAAAAGLINFQTTTGLTLDTVMSGSALLGPIAGVTTVNGTVLLHTGAGLGQTAAAPVTAANFAVRNDASGDINLLTAIDYTAGTGNTVGRFAAVNGAAGGRADLATLGSLTVGDVAGDGTFAAVHGIKTTNGGSNIRAGNSFTANDTNFASNQLVQLGTGEFLVNPGQTLAAQGMVDTVDTVTFDAGIVAGKARFGVPGAVDATATNPGPAGTQIPNVAREAFSNIRPSEFTPIFVNGNLPTTFPGDSLTLDVHGVTGLTAFVDPGQGNGHFTFTNRQPLVFTSIENLAQRSLLAVSVQTGGNSFQILVQGTFAGLPSSAPFPLNPPQSNPFIVSPQLVNPVQPFGAPRVAVGDVNGDGVTDLIVAGGPDSAPLVTVVDGSKLFGVQSGAQVTATLIAQFFAYDPRFVGGVFVAVGDLSKTDATGKVVPGQDGKAEIVTGPDQGGGPHVREFRFTNSGLINDTFADVSVGAAYPAGGFYAYDASFHGGVRVAIGDVDGDGFNDIVTGAGPGGGPHVKVRSGVTGGTIRSFFAYDAAFHGGVYVGAGDYDLVLNGIEPGRGTADIVTGAGQGGGPHVKVFSGADLSVLVSEFAFGRDGATSLFGPDLGLTTGVGSVSFADVDGDGLPDILVTSARGPRTRIAALRGNGPTPAHIHFVNPPATPGPGQAVNPFPQLFQIDPATGDLMAPQFRDGSNATDLFST